jgi:peptidyl-prolyl cis-trans isomerase C
MKLRMTAVAVASALTMACAQDDTGTAEESSSAVQADPLGTSTVTTEDGTAVPESLFRYYALNALQKQPEDLTAEEREAVLESVARLSLLADAAEEAGLPQERMIAVELELQRMQLLARAMVNRYVQENPPTEAELRAEYEASQEEFAATELKARHILLETEEEAQAVIEELQEGADFAEMAQQHSTGPTGPDGGDLGWFNPDSMVPPFAEAASAMEVGSYTSEPVQTQFGWHVILLEDRRENQAPGLDAVRADITNRVNQKKLEEYIGSLEVSDSQSLDAN